MTATRLPSALQIARRGALWAAWGACIAALGMHSGMAQEAAEVRMQLDQQALNISRGPKPEGAQCAGQSEADYLSHRWGALAFLDPWCGTRDASTP
jgi:hypothetical protein